MAAVSCRPRRLDDIPSSSSPDTAIPVLSSLVCVLVTSSLRGHVAGVAVGQQQGLGHDSAVNRDNIFTRPRQVLT
jgi:mRNA-degrading endonuclease toxin of MazEF toxin-antitoxin module